MMIPAKTPQEVLEFLGIAYEQRDDGMLFVPGSIRLSGMELEQLPDLSNVHVQGDFFCHVNKLTSLKGSPAYVGGSFHCQSNQLTTLKGAPDHIGAAFVCTDNKLTTLEGAPKTFKALHSGFEDFGKFGIFYSWDDIPEHLRLSPETKERITRQEREAKEAFERKVQKNTITQKPVKLLPKIKVRR